MNINERIIAKTKELGVSQVELAKRTGLTKGAVNQWFKGASAPNGENLLKTATALGVTPEWLQTGKESRARAVDTSMPRDAHPSVLTQQLSDELSRLVSCYNNAGDAKKASLEMLAALPEHEMSTMLLLLKSLSDKYKDAP